MPIDIKMPDGVVVRFPDSYTKEQIRDITYQKFPELNPLNQGNEFTRGVKRGVAQTKALIGEGVPAVAQSLSNQYLGTDFDVQENLEAYQKQTGEAQRDFPTSVPSFKDIEGFQSIGDFIAATAGEQIPQLGTSLLGGGVGGLAFKEGAKRLAQKAGKELTEKELDKAVKKGLLGGTLLTSGSQNIPETYFNLLSEGEDAPTTALLTGALKTGLDVIPQVQLLERILGPRAGDIVGDSLLKNIGAGALRTGVQEGITESAQESLDLIAEKFVLDSAINTPENIERLINAGLKGAIGGSVFGAAGATIQDVDAKPFDPNNLSDKEKQKLDATFQEEILGVVPPKSRKPNITDAVLKPLYVDNETLDTFEANGVNTESLNRLNPVEIKEVGKTLSPASLNTLNSVTTPITNFNPASQKEIEAIKTRQQDIKSANRQGDTDFFVGDGEIVMGVPLNPTSRINIPAQELVTGNSVALSNYVSQANQEPSIDDTYTIPENLDSDVPRFNFESAYDKALFVSQVQPELRKNIKEKTGKTDKEIDTDLAELERRMDSLTRPSGASTPITVPRKAQADLPQIKLPKYGDLQSDLVAPQAVSNNLKQVGFTQAATAKLQPQLKQFERVLKEVFPKINPKRFKPFQNINTKSLPLDPVYTSQYMNTVALALDTKTPKALDETQLNEAWHFLVDNGVFTSKELNKLSNELKGTTDYLLNQGEPISAFDLQSFTTSPEGRQELIANAFTSWMKDTQNINELPSNLKRPFSKAKNFLNRFGSALRGLDFKNVEDVFEAKENPVTKEIQRVSDTLEDVNYNNRVSRLQRISNENRRTYATEGNFNTLDDYTQAVSDARIKANTNTKISGKQIGLFGRYINSLAHAASNNPFLAQIYSAVERRLINSQKLLEGYMDALQDFQKQDKAIRYRLHNLADYLRQTRQNPEFDSEGRLVFERDGQRVRINNPEINRQFNHMQNAYKKVLDDYGDMMRTELTREFPDLLPSPNFTSQDIDTALAQLEGKEGVKRKVERLNDAKKLFNEFSIMRDRAFVPHMRFGNWGITVRDKDTGDQVAFYTVEGGGFRKLYNRYQLEQTAKELKKKYSDTNKYEIIGGNGVVKNITAETLEPFKLTHATLKNQVDTRFLNIELLSSLLASKDLSIEDYEQIRTEIYNDILKKGFANRFDESKGIDGYSKDWDRVQHAYLTGASHYLSGLPYQRELSTLQTEAEKLDDDRLKDLAMTYLDYTNSPHEDFQMLRSFNFMWTMGGNISTALLQVFTLPTTTLGSMTQYNPNVLANMKHIGKWMALAPEFFPSLMKTVQTHNGLFYADFRNDEIINGLIQKGKMTEDEARFLYKMSSQLRGFLTEEYSGFKPFETRSLGGSLKGKLSTGANWLGIPISTMEQMTRFATAMGTYSMLKNNPKALKRAEKILKNDHRFQAQNTNFQDFDFAENVAKFSMDEAHAVFGKVGRAPFQKGVGGALFFPFMTYPQQALEFIFRSAQRGPGGLRGSLTTLGALFFFSGLLGLPGAELFKELYEEIEKEITGSEEDLDFVIREKVYDQTGDVRFAKFVTQGIGRGYLDLDIARRVGLPIPGQDLLMTLMGIQGSPTDLLGVSGSLANSMATAWRDSTQGASGMNVLSSMLPVAPANVLKSISMGEQGVSTRRGLQLLTPEEVTARTQLLRAIGVGSDQVATKREEAFAKIIADRKFKPAMDKFRAKAKRIDAAIVKAQEERDWVTLREEEMKYQELMEEFDEFAVKNDIVPDFAAFNRSIVESTLQRLDPTVKLKDVRRLGRESFSKTQEVLGLTNKE